MVVDPRVGVSLSTRDHKNRCLFLASAGTPDTVFVEVKPSDEGSYEFYVVLFDPGDALSEQVLNGFRPWDEVEGVRRPVDTWDTRGLRSRGIRGDGSTQRRTLLLVGLRRHGMWDT
jgi:hypothetical protein